ncbi:MULTISPECIES: enoyl-CoA hydratase [Microbulbifer]|uniref:Enoyl-CoA hydratase n=1 Tax=Microbulbifer celer TaxID=435905 RepID=A0ABW3U2Z2_9GAMM|nr:MULTISPECIES: enoyl-CoA hydratase [Microbulbifer]UFN56187.1 enoyl-CoA hydratase [Microbulbifer celer]
MQSSCAEIRSEVQDRVLEITISRPDRKNALTMAMYSAMAELLDSAASDPAIRVVIITGSNGVFTSGNDLTDFLGGSAAGEESPVYQFMRALYEFPKPVIAAVSGYAVGIGTTLLLHCDLSIADDDAVFQLPFVNLGLCPEYASSYLLPRIMGQAKAAELLLLGNKFDAQTAADVNICNEVVYAGEALGRARSYAAELAKKAPAAVRLTKQLLRRGTQERGMEIIREEAGHFQERLQSEEFREAATAFMEKRPADFSKFD